MWGLPGIDVEFPDIASRFLPYLGWAYMDNVLVITYEELMMDLADESYDVYWRIAEHVNAWFVPGEVEEVVDIGGGLTRHHFVVNKMVSSVKPKESGTFRAGKIGEWKEAFSQETKDYWDKYFRWLFDLMNELPEGGTGWR